ncbi:hypothetical protein [Serratia marcescens]|uniref:hypothetical protein n=1 Tax=Serratia marcescens TaxID=615 RepID=UPI0027E3BAAB|nr:hypothetical protein [Serratia marcescens]WLS17215.1 hypothetical protein RAA91_00190 [Serratia marcescens]HCB1447369.1 hypothetical protein [Serratia marcescens]HCB1484853.1 hypothetical protein [Serratia marcescens]HCB1614622.1 hypothetical protein [Serratia marcescens]HCB1620040.1 hypothetical protein [Serratia marcescens]
MDLVNHIIEILQKTSWSEMLFYAAYITLYLVFAIVIIGKGIPAICKWMLGK